MDPELKRLLEENLKITKNNNDILRSIRHHQWLGLLTSTVFWIVIIAAPIYAFQHYIQPFLSHSHGNATSTPAFFVVPTSADLQKLLNSFK